MKVLKKGLITLFVLLSSIFICSPSFAEMTVESSDWWTNQSTSAWWATQSNNWWSSKSEDCIEVPVDIPWLTSNWCVTHQKAETAFGSVMWWLMKLFINFTVAIAFLSLIAAGVMYSMVGVNQNIAGKWKEMLKKVLIWIVLLWMSGLILHTINPNFFKSSLTYVLVLNSK